MEEDKLGLGEAKSNNNSSSSSTKEAEKEEEKANLNLGSSPSATENGEQEDPPRQSSSRRTPFTNLSQVDADLALARTLQEQERAYMMLRFNNIEGSDYGSWEAASYLHHHDDDDFGDPDDDDDDDDDDDETDGDDDDEDDHGTDDVDAFDVHESGGAAADLDPCMFSSDEAYARALQDAEEREMAARLLAFAGINDQVEDTDDHGGNSQDAWEEVDPDELSYEELIALGEVVGSESRGLSADTIASLPTVNYKAGSSQNGTNDSCVICRLDYEDGETLTLLSCKHSYHSECINNWLKINKVCPVCSTEVSTSGHS
ncbi:E3 ubiquitin ligase BIG BROTHER-related [Ricinus communis]|uniref:E3 ubiquitin ligase BIG BROTHER-related n=1 Tax=Ricinus communis TaxID=3988 RepID=UPI00201A5EAC|nr:E3 ubiquitin ligase BIG BROTHER-related [Ricinus communis]